VIKSGANQLHGLAYESALNSVFAARGFFSTVKPENNQNEFGATLGGPDLPPENSTSRSWSSLVI
jgi:hypothetical protein